MDGWDDGRRHDGRYDKRNDVRLVLRDTAHCRNFGDCRSSNDGYSITRNYPVGHSCSGIFNDRIYRNESFYSWCHHWNYW